MARKGTSSRSRVRAWRMRWASAHSFVACAGHSRPRASVFYQPLRLRAPAFRLLDTVRVYTISVELPYAQDRWVSTEAMTHEALSAHKSEQFGSDYGVLIKEWRLLQRTVFVIGSDSRTLYADYVTDQMSEPDYAAALDAVQRAAAKRMGLYRAGRATAWLGFGIPWVRSHRRRLQIRDAQKAEASHVLLLKARTTYVPKK
jgi:hypothetical protein